MSIPSQVILNHVVESFIGLPVQENSESKPATDSCSDRYSVAFPHTDFVKPLKADYVIEIAQSLELIVAHAISLTDCDILIGEADRLLGSIIHEMSASTGIPYSLINWYPEGSPGEFVVQKNRGFSGTGVSYLNGIKPGMQAVVIGDTLDCTLNDILKSIQNAGASTIHVCYILDLVPNGVTKKLDATLISLDKGLESKGIPSLSILAGIDMDPTTKVTMLAPGYPIELKSSVCLPKPKPVPCVSDLKSLTEETRSDALRRIESGFVGIPIISNPDLNYPYCFLQLTDFVPIMTPDVVERMADMCVALSACLPDACDLLVSECDRGGGPLVQSLAKRLRTIPFVMAMWSTRALNDTTSVAAQIGFSGQGILRVNGVDAWRSAYAPRNKTAKPRIVFVDDMLSSGGTAEGVLKAVESAGGITEEAIFISEKIYVDEPVPRKGFERLMKTWPKLKITSLIQFAVSGSKTRKVAKEEWVH